MPFNFDFIDILRNYGQLPITSIHGALELVKERDAIKMTLDHSLLSDEMQKEQLQKLQQFQLRKELSDKQRQEYEDARLMNVHLLQQLTKSRLIQEKHRLAEKEEKKVSTNK